MKTKKVYGRQVVKGSVVGTILLAGFMLLGHWVGADLNRSDGGTEQTVVASEDGTAYFQSGDQATRSVVIGFDSEPVTLELSDPLVPKVVVGDVVHTANDSGVIFVSDAAGMYLAVDEQAIVEVGSITK